MGALNNTAFSWNLLIICCRATFNENMQIEAFFASMLTGVLLGGAFIHIMTAETAVRWYLTVDSVEGLAG